MDETLQYPSADGCRNPQRILDSDQASVITVAVIIPYFQKRAGILRRALSSVLEQRLSSNTAVHIVVVDDGSPVPARTEIEGLHLPSNFRLQLVEQPNGGVSAARNTGLRQVSEDTTYIAFIDSDDIWDPEHIPAALGALDKGYDTYFCNNRRDGFHDCYFKATNFYPPMGDCSNVNGDVYEIEKEFLFTFTLRAFVSQLSTFVYRYSVARDLSFYETLRTAGEDTLFVLKVFCRSQNICFSPAIRVTCGDGVNIWYGRYSWDAAEHRASQLACLIGAREVRKSVRLSVENSKFMDSNISCLRKFFAYLIVRWFLKTGQLGSKEIYDLARSDRWFWLWYPPSILYIAISFPLGLYTPPKI